jgi:hypothetical protein
MHLDPPAFAGLQQPHLQALAVQPMLKSSMVQPTLFLANGMPIQLPLQAGFSLQQATLAMMDTSKLSLAQAWAVHPL